MSTDSINLTLADQAFRIANRKLGTAPYKLPRKSHNNSGVLVHGFDCPRYGHSGADTKKCKCSRHIPQPQADALVDAGVVAWLKTYRQGKPYRTRHSVVILVPEVALVESRETKTAQGNLPDALYLKNAPHGKGKIVLLGGRLLEFVMAHDNGGGARRRAIAEMAACIGDKLVREVYRQDLQQIGYGENRVRPQGHGPDSFDFEDDDSQTGRRASFF